MLGTFPSEVFSVLSARRIEPEASLGVMDKRKNARLPLRLSGQLSLEYGEHLETETKDVSLRGARVGAVPAVDPLQRCVLTLFAEGPEVFSVTIDAMIVYQDENGCGIEFQSMDANDFELFKEFIERQTRDRSDLEREVEEGNVPKLKDWTEL